MKRSSNTWRRVWSGIASTALAFGVISIVGPTPAYAAGCPTGPGVTVVVDATSLGGGVSTGCSTTDPNSGLTALTNAGFSYSFVANQPGFICRINNLPDPCPGIPPVDQYWSYWHAQPGGSWTYSTKGAGNFDPPAGSVEGWSFGAGNPPSIAPPTRNSPPPVDDGDKPGDNPGTTKPGDSNNGNKDDPTNEQTGKPTDEKTAEKTDDTDTSMTPSKSVSPVANDDMVETELASANSDGDSVGLVTPIVGGTIILGLGTAMWWRARQRRLSGSDA